MHKQNKTHALNNENHTDKELQYRENERKPAANDVICKKLYYSNYENKETKYSESA